jgi:glutathione S-transferase
LITLYYAPGACSLASHVLLRQLGLAHEARRVDTSAGEHRGEAFLAVNPRGLVPALRTPSGVVLTESIAVLRWVAAQAPAAGLWPDDPLEQARALEIMSWLATRPHPLFARWFAPEREGVAPADRDRARAAAAEAYAGALAHTVRMLPEGEHALGERPSIVDPYLLVFWLWARHMQLDLRGLPRLERWGAQMFAQPAVQQVLQIEGLIPPAA